MRLTDHVAATAFTKAMQSEFAFFAYSGVINGLVYGIVYEVFRQKWSRRIEGKKNN